MNNAFKVSIGTNVDQTGVAKDVMDLANRLACIHGDVCVTQESRGTHLYMACPSCLEQDGAKELRSRHLAVNADRYFGLGKWINARGTYNADRSALCMKESKPFEVSDLLNMQKLEQRGIQDKGPGTVKTVNKEHRLITDANGNRIPEDPGVVKPVTELPDWHPALEFLRCRNYDPETLYRHLQASFCVEEKEEDRSAGRMYRRMPGGFKDTPQGRIVLYAYQNGVRVSWQARILEKEDQDYKYFLHPYLYDWVPVYHRNSLYGVQEGASKWSLLPEFQGSEYLNWDPSKYRTATGTKRNQIVMGFDAALQHWQQLNKPRHQRFAVITEGPLDAARLGPPAVALLGKFLSDDQVNLVLKHFGKVVIVGDNDSRGKEAAQKAYAKFSQSGTPVTVFTLPDGVDDPGELTPLAAQSIMRSFYKL